MATAALKKSTARPVGRDLMGTDRLHDLGKLSAVDIETKLVGDLGRAVHSLFDPVAEAPLPIYFGPLLGRLFLEGF